MSSLERAIAIAVAAHGGQRDKAGEPYILHALRVMFASPKGEAQIVGVLHDVVEDSMWTPAELTREGFSDDVLNAIRALTHDKHEPYTTNYISRVLRFPLARSVKIADLIDNLDRSRIPNPTERDQQRWAKYETVLAILRGPAMPLDEESTTGRRRGPP